MLNTNERIGETTSSLSLNMLQHHGQQPTKEGGENVFKKKKSFQILLEYFIKVFCFLLALDIEL